MLQYFELPVVYLDREAFFGDHNMRLGCRCGWTLGLWVRFTPLMGECCASGTIFHRRPDASMRIMRITILWPSTKHYLYSLIPDREMVELLPDRFSTCP